jgi:hypothetical protein
VLTQRRGEDRIAATHRRTVVRLDSDRDRRGVDGAQHAKQADREVSTSP